VERDPQGRPLVSGDLVVIMNLPRRDGTGEANVTMRGITPMGVTLRPQVTLVNGRWFTPGQREVVVSRKMAQRFATASRPEIQNRRQCPDRGRLVRRQRQRV
jgi:putative ABC transport system permease protein